MCVVRWESQFSFYTWLSYSRTFCWKHFFIPFDCIDAFVSQLTWSLPSGICILFHLSIGKSWLSVAHCTDISTFIFFSSKITVGGDGSHEIKRHLLLGRKAMTNLGNMLKRRGITLPTKVHIVKAMVFLVVMYGYESWTVKKVEHRRIDAFELWCWRRLLRVPWTARRSNQSITNSQSSLRFTSIESVMPSSHLILCRPLLLLPPIPPSIRDFYNESTLHMRWPNYWRFSFSIIPSKEIPGLISFRKDWLDVLAVQGTLKSLLQHHSSIASILWHSAFFTVQLSHPYMTTGETIALTAWTFIGKVMSLLFNNTVEVCHCFSSKEQVSFNFMASVTIHSDLGAPQNSVSLFPLFPHLHLHIIPEFLRKSD